MFEAQAQALEKHRDLILETQRFIWAHPETGFREEVTAPYMEDAFERLGYDLHRAGDIPGFYTVIDTGRPGPEVLVLGELDALICAEHPEADPKTGAVHCCGHSAQCAALVGLAAALREDGILDGLSGRIRLCAVPAEEMIELEYRTALKRSGKIRYLNGKSEFLYRGLFDGVDMALMVHITGGTRLFACKGSVGCIVKRIIYKGKAAHAGGTPWLGCNALYAATQGLNAVNAIRETFQESDLIRCHSIITKGGDAVNVIPETVIIESYVRGSSFKAIAQANRRVNCALCGAALSLGANVEIQDVPGYAPLINDATLMKVAEEAAQILPSMSFRSVSAVGSASTDMGALSCIMPVIHPYIPGAAGMAHSADYRIENPELACLGSGKWLLAMLTVLLQDGAARAKQIVQDYTPLFSDKNVYFAAVDALADEGDRICYCEDRAEVRI